MRLHRYLFSQYFQVTSVVLFSLIMVVWLNQTLQLLELVVNKGSPLISFLYLSILAMPLWLLQAIPIALLIGIIWVVNKINADRELVAMQSVGWSTQKFTYAPLAFAALCTAFLVVNSVYILPTSFGEFKTRQLELRVAIPKILLQDKVFVDLAPGLTIFIDERLSSQKVRNVFIQDKRDGETITTLTASDGTFGRDNGQPYLLLENGERSQIDTKSGEASATLFFESYKLNIARGEVNSSSNRPLDMNEDSIRNLLNPETSNGERFINQRLAYGHYRITSPFLAITLSIIAVAGLTRGRLRDQYKTQRIWGTIIIALFVQILFISARSATVTAPILWPLQYIVLIVPSLCGLALIFLPNLQFARTNKVVSS